MNVELNSVSQNLHLCRTSEHNLEIGAFWCDELRGDVAEVLTPRGDGTQGMSPDFSCPGCGDLTSQPQDTNTATIPPKCRCDGDSLPRLPLTSLVSPGGTHLAPASLTHPSQTQEQLSFDNLDEMNQIPPNHNQPNLIKCNRY